VRLKTCAKNQLWTCLCLLPLQKSPNLSFLWLQRRVGAQVGLGGLSICRALPHRLICGTAAQLHGCTSVYMY
jgi:hypothetical protein